MRFSLSPGAFLLAACLLPPHPALAAPAGPKTARTSTSVPALPSRAPAGAAIAIVNGEAVPLSLYLDRLSLRYGPEIRDGLIDETLLRQEAKRRRITASAKEIEAATTDNYRQSVQTYGSEQKLAAELKRIRGWTSEQYRWMIRSQAESVVLREKLAKALVPASAISDAEIEKRYTEFKEAFTEPDSVRISHILFAHKTEPPLDADARRRAQATLDRVRLGGAATFEQAAKESSEDTASRPLGGRLPFDIRKGENPYGAAFEAAVFPAPIGLVGEVIAAPDGYHVVRVDMKTPGRQRTLAEVKEDLRARMLVEKRNEALEALFVKLHSAAKTRVERY